LISALHESTGSVSLIFCTDKTIDHYMKVGEKFEETVEAWLKT